MATEKKNKLSYRGVFRIGAGSIFLISSGYGIFKMFTTSPESSGGANPDTPSIEQQLQSTEAGYKKVLEREPENIFALQGLVETRLQMNDFAGSIAPLEKLIELDPENENLQTLLVVVKQKNEQQQKNAVEGGENQNTETEKNQ